MDRGGVANKRCDLSSEPEHLSARLFLFQRFLQKPSAHAQRPSLIMSLSG
jgi:hypothetical protein